jgi:hypothetical protein
MKSLWYKFNVTIDSTASISHFWFEMDEHDGTPPKQMYNEQGAPFPVEDRFFIVPNMSCQKLDPSAPTTTNLINATFAVSI